MNDPVVITGKGMVTSLGLTLSETWNALLAGKTGIKLIEDFDAGGFECQSAAQVHGLNSSVLNIHPRDARIMDKHSFMLMKCAHDAFKDSSIDRASISGGDIGFFAGMGMVDHSIEDLLPGVRKSLDNEGNIDYDRFFSKGYQEIYPLWPLSMLNNISFCQVAISLDIRGENSVFSPHGDSGVHAIAEAAKAVREQKAKIALAGGVSEKVSPANLARTHLAGILNKDEAVCRPFSTDRKGTLLGEGSGVVALELRLDADARGASYSSMVTGYGSSFGLDDNASAPTPKAILRSMQSALKSAGISPSDIDLIIANGDGTLNGDKNEIGAIHQLFSDCLDRVSVFSSKGALGNLFAGAPSVDLVLGVQMLETGLIPATLNSQPLDEDIKFRLVTDEPLQTSAKRIMVNSQSYEGQCASLIIEKT